MTNQQECQWDKIGANCRCGECYEKKKAAFRYLENLRGPDNDHLDDHGYARDNSRDALDW